MSGAKEAAPVCPGCGVRLQADAEDEQGYVPAAKLAELTAGEEAAAPLCRRCFRLRHYGELDDDEVPTKEDALGQIELALERADSAWLLVDLTDVGVCLSEDVVAPLRRRAKTIVVVGTKYDLLPKVAVLDEVRDWLRRQAQCTGLNPTGVVLSGRGRLLETRLWGPAAGVIALVGATNSGKSTLLSRLARRSPARPLVARLSGTTRGLLQARTHSELLGSALLIDTPGVPVGRARASDGLGASCASQLVSSKSLSSRLERLVPGEACLLGGMASLSLEGGTADQASAGATLLIYVPEAVHLHKTKASRREELWEAHAGRWLVPPGPRCRSLLVQRGFQTVSLHVRPRQDIEFGGLGWISIRGRATSDAYPFAATVPAGTLVRTRSALLGPRSFGNGGRQEGNGS